MLENAAKNCRKRACVGTIEEIQVGANHEIFQGLHFSVMPLGGYCGLRCPRRMRTGPVIGNIDPARLQLPAGRGSVSLVKSNWMVRVTKVN